MYRIYIKYILTILVILFIVILILKHNQYIIQTDYLVKKPPKDIYIINNFIDTNQFNYLKRLIENHYLKYNYRTDNFIRKGSAVSHHLYHNTDMQIINNILDKPETLKKIETETGLKIQFVPKTDPSRISILIY